MTYSGPEHEHRPEPSRDNSLRDIWLHKLVEDGGLDATPGGAYIRGGYGDVPYPLDTESVHDVFPTGNTNIPGDQKGKTDGEYTAS